MVFMEGLFQCDLVSKVFGVLSSSPTIYIYVVNNELYKCLFCCYAHRNLNNEQAAVHQDPFLTA